jgi:hypothetical protein
MPNELCQIDTQNHYLAIAIEHKMIQIWFDALQWIHMIFLVVVQIGEGISAHVKERANTNHFVKKFLVKY